MDEIRPGRQNPQMEKKKGNIWIPVCLLAPSCGVLLSDRTATAPQFRLVCCLGAESAVVPVCAGVEGWAWSWPALALACSLPPSWSSTTRRATSCITLSSPAAPCCASSACCCCRSREASPCRRAWPTGRPSPAGPCSIQESSTSSSLRSTGTTPAFTTRRCTSRPPGALRWQLPPLWQRCPLRTPSPPAGR